MRAKEFLSEATLAGTSADSWPKYLQYMLTATNLALGNNGELVSGLRLDPNGKRVVQNLIAG